MVLGEVAVGALVSGNSDADGADDEAVGLTGGVLCDDREDDLAGVQILQAFFARIILQCGGKMELTRTRFCAAIPALRVTPSRRR